MATKDFPAEDPDYEEESEDEGVEFEEDALPPAEEEEEDEDAEMEGDEEARE